MTDFVMYTAALILITFLSVVYGERYTSIFYRNEPFSNFPPSRTRKYRVFEGEEDIRQDSAGHKLRFAYNPPVARASMIDAISFDGLKGEFRQNHPNFAPARSETRRYGFRPLLREESVSSNDFQQRNFNINRPLLRYRTDSEDRYLPERSSPSLRYEKKPIAVYYIRQPYANLIHENQYENERKPRNHHLPIHTEQRYPTMVYSPTYAYAKDLNNPVPSSSHLPEYISSDQGGNSNHLFYSPGYKYHGDSEGGFVEKYHTDEEKKKIAEDESNKEQGKKKDEYVEDEKKFKKNEEAAHHKSSDSEQYANEEVKKKNIEDEENYNGGKSYKQEEQNENEKKNKSSHKKGHIVRSFKNSHHKEETGNNEEYYDEEHDLGDSYKFDASAGHFGEDKAETFKGDHEQKEFATNERVNKGGHESSEILEKVKEDQNENKQSKEDSNTIHYGNSKFKDEQSLLGHQESKKLFEENPYHTPIRKNL